MNHHRESNYRFFWIIAFWGISLSAMPAYSSPAPGKTLSSYVLTGSASFFQESSGDFEKFWEDIKRIWHYQILKVQEKPIYVKTIILGVLLLVLSFWIAKIISRVLGKRILPKLGLNQSAASAFQTVGFYLLIIIFTLFVLQVIDVPLTIFTLLGGALAIGVGFGSQNIMNNFISGLIILAERPIKIGDLIQMDDLYGAVNHIGARSTRIRTSDNIEIIVPNSVFLENRVINWTLTDNQVRTRVAVGVSYGSDTELVKTILLQAAEEHSNVLESPMPLVLFRDFGDNSLNFEVLFWLVMRSQMDRLNTESDLRFRIDALCREKGVVIAFPQRDVHLDTLKPLEVHLTK